MADVQIPYVTPQYIVDGENIEADVANRPNIQIQENVLALRDRLGNLIDTVNALEGDAEEYDPNKVYNEGDVVADSDGKLYRSLQDNNQGHPLDDTNWWEPFTGTSIPLERIDHDPTDADADGKPLGHIVYSTASGNIFILYNDSPVQWFNLTTFINQTDTPSSYSGNADNIVVVNSTEDGLVFTDTIDGGTYGGG